jgi:GTP cyclohydrolase II
MTTSDPHTSLIEYQGTAQLPTRFGTFEMALFLEHATGKEHLALLMRPWQDAPLVRLHSECLTGDALSSLRCDCGPQLQLAQEAVAREGGAILYLRQEGRGIGLAGKVQAYALQDNGLDTVDANLHLGFGADERDYAVAVAMLEWLGIGRLRLLTNNPRKVDALAAHGITVVERVPALTPPNPYNADYLETKRTRLDHFFPNGQKR